MSQLASLHDAIKDGDFETAIRLAEKGADINATYIRETAFTEALEAGRTNIAIRIMGMSNFDYDAGNKFERTPLFCAAKDGRYEIAQALLDMGADISKCDIRGVTPLGATAWYDQHQVAQLLIDRGADVNQQDATGETPLFRACASVSIGVAKVLLKNGADVNLPTYENNSSSKFTPLMAALPSKYQLEVRKRKMTEMISLTKLMLSHGSDLNAINQNGGTALHVAVDRNELYGVCLLIENGCDIEIRDNDGLTPFQLAIQPIRPLYEMALFLILYGADVNSTFKDKENGEEILPLTMVMRTRAENELVQKHRTRLLYALIPATDFSHKGIFGVIQTMLEDTPVPEADFNILKEFHVDQPSSLQCHCRRGIRKSLGQQVLRKIEMLPVGWQLQRYISLDFDYRRNHPLYSCSIHTAVLDNDTETLKNLMRGGCDVNTPLGDKTPLTLAAEVGNVQAVEVLLEHGADPSRLDKYGLSALHSAAHNASDNVIKVLLKANCDVNSVNAEGNTPIQEAANMGHFDTVLLLLDNNGDTSLVGPSGIPCIHLAAGSGHLKAVKSILKKSQDKQLLDKFGNTPLHIAASRGIAYLKNNIRLPALYKEEVMELLDAARLPLTAGGLPQYVRSDGVHHLEVVKLLLENQVDKEILNSDKKLAVDLAEVYFRDCVQLF